MESTSSSSDKVFAQCPSVGTWLKPLRAEESNADAQSTPLQGTVMLTYGGAAGGMGKCGSFDNPKEWFGFKKHALSADAPVPAHVIFQEMLQESDAMRAAITMPFPVPQFKSDGIDLPSGSELEEISRLDALCTPPNQADKVKHIASLMEPNPNFVSFESQGDQYYLYGPFASTAQFIDALKLDPMLQPVYEKWSTIEASTLDEAFQYGTVYFQIKWQGWFVRPVLEMTSVQLTQLMNKATSTDAQAKSPCKSPRKSLGSATSSPQRASLMPCSPVRAAQNAPWVVAAAAAAAADPSAKADAAPKARIVKPVDRAALKARAAATASLQAASAKTPKRPATAPSPEASPAAGKTSPRRAQATPVSTAPVQAEVVGSCTEKPAGSSSEALLVAAGAKPRAAGRTSPRPAAVEKKAVAEVDSAAEAKMAEAKAAKAEADVKAKATRAEADAKFKVAKAEADAKALAAKLEAEARVKAAKSEAEAKAKAAKAEAEAKKVEVAEAKAAKAEVDAKAKAAKVEADAKAKAVKVEADAKAKVAKAEAEKKAKAEAEAKKAEAAEAAKAAKADADVKAKAAKAEAEAKVKAAKVEADAKAKAKAEVDAKAKAAKAEADTKFKAAKAEADAQVRAAKAEVEATAQAVQAAKAEVDAKAQADKAEAQALVQAAKAETDAKATEAEAEAKAAEALANEAMAEAKAAEADAKSAELVVVGTACTLVGPPWYIAHNVTPGAAPKDMGSWSSVQFTLEQQASYGVNADGEVVDAAVHAVAFEPKYFTIATMEDVPVSPAVEMVGADTKVEAKVTAGPPWYVVHNVKPEATPKDMGDWTAVQFTGEQQSKYGVNADGEVVDAAVHAAAFKVDGVKATPKAKAGKPLGRPASPATRTAATTRAATPPKRTAPAVAPRAATPPKRTTPVQKDARPASPATRTAAAPRPASPATRTAAAPRPASPATRAAVAPRPASPATKQRASTPDATTRQRPASPAVKARPASPAVKTRAASPAARPKAAAVATVSPPPASPGSRQPRKSAPPAPKAAEPVGDAADATNTIEDGSQDKIKAAKMPICANSKRILEAASMGKSRRALIEAKKIETATFKF